MSIYFRVVICEGEFERLVPRDQNVAERANGQYCRKGARVADLARCFKGIANLNTLRQGVAECGEQRLVRIPR